eukprot:m.95876 g.95876  ORF g.95876 m.95876 type:complete len:702 (-) comp15469_c0_seq1:359-2464(-)
MQRWRVEGLFSCLNEVREVIEQLGSPALQDRITAKLSNLEESILDEDEWCFGAATDPEVHLAFLSCDDCGHVDLLRSFLHGWDGGEHRKSMLELMDGKLNDPPHAPIGPKHKMTMSLKGTSYQVKIRSTIGDANPQVLLWADTSIVCYDCTDKETFDAVEGLLGKVMKYRRNSDMPIFVVGISGRSDRPTFPESELKRLSAFQGSVKLLTVNPYTGLNVMRLFNDAIHEVVDTQQARQSGERDRIGTLDTSKLRGPPVKVLLDERGEGRSIPIKQGVLRKFHMKGTISSQKRYATLTQGAFTYFGSLQEYMSDARGKRISLLGTTVKKPMKSSKPSQSPIRERFYFTIVSLDGRSWQFETKNQKENDEWVSLIEAEIHACLNRGLSQSAAKGGQPNMLAFAPLSKEKLQKLQSVAGNRVCADCDKPDPTWCSLNLGTLFCIECSGIHRNLGVHISRVRSIELDDWNEEYLNVMLKVGNARANRVWESALGQRQKPGPDASSAERERFITEKYRDKAFLRRIPGVGQRLYESVLQDDYDTGLLALAQSDKTDVNYADPDEGRTPLHAACDNGSAFWVRMLLWYSANVDTLDKDGFTPLSYAKGGDYTDIVDMLVSAGANVNIEFHPPAASRPLRQGSPTADFDFPPPPPMLLSDDPPSPPPPAIPPRTLSASSSPEGRAGMPPVPPPRMSSLPDNIHGTSHS